MIKENVDQLKMIQLGLTLATKDGKYPSDTCTWQFNFNFDLEYFLDFIAAERTSPLPMLFSF